MDFFKSDLPGQILTAGTSLFGNAMNVKAARQQQKREMKWQEDFWNKQNQYNSPQAQMKRLQEAGLNPNLVYGGSSGGTAGTAEMMRVPDMDPSGNRVIDTQGAADLISSIYDFDVKQAQTDNLKAQTQVNQENAMYKATQTYGEGIKNARSRLDLRLAEELYHTSADSARESLRKLKADTQYTLDQNERQQVMLSRNVAESIERVLTQRLGRKLTRENIRSIREDMNVKRLDSEFAEKGIRPTDPPYIKLLGHLIGRFEQLLGKKWKSPFE